MSGKTKSRKGLLERLRNGPILGDGGMVFGLEKRGYVKAGSWTPECTVLQPEAGRILTGSAKLCVFMLNNDL